MQVENTQTDLVMKGKLTDCFKTLRVIPIPFGDYQQDNPETPPFLVNFRLQTTNRKLPIALQNGELLYTDRETICKLSKVCADEIEKLEKEGKELIIRLEHIPCDTMERLLFATCPTIYEHYPLPPTVFDVDVICPVAHELQIGTVIKMCEQILENDVHPELTPTDLLISLFNVAFKCKLKPALQAKLFNMVLECEYWKIKHQFLRSIDSPCLRIFLWNFRNTIRYFKYLERARRDGCFIKREKSWFTVSTDPKSKDLLRLCTYNEMRFSHLAVTVSTKVYKSTCKQCEEDAARISRTDGYFAKEIPQKLYLCQLCDAPLCPKCEGRFCAAELLSFLEDIRKTDEIPDVIDKLRTLVILNTSAYDSALLLL